MRATDEWAFLLPVGWERLAGEAGANAVYRPTPAPDGALAPAPVPASITEIELDGLVGLGVGEVAELILTNGYERSERVELDGRPGARLTSTRLHGHRSGEPAVLTRQVTYLVSRDDTAGAWLALAFSTAWDGEGTRSMADALVDFFDAAMETFRWTGPGAVADLGVRPGARPGPREIFTHLVRVRSRCFPRGNREDRPWPTSR